MSEEVKKLGQYTLLEKIAQGGMAQVFKAKTVDSHGFERLVVIKRILPHISADQEYVEMLVDEAKIAVNFTHGNIAQIYDLGRVKNDYFIVMEYVDGRTFSQINKQLAQYKKRMPLDILLYCAIEICHGLSYIHNKRDVAGKHLGVVHRDISPQNIILSYAGQIKIIDFGVAKARNKEGKTESGVLKGKFAYMSPEQSRSDTIDSRSDIFSLGTLMWESLTSQRLFKRKSNHETVKAIQKIKYTMASSVRSDTPRELEKILKKALQKNPRHRYQDAADMALDLEKLLFTINPDFKPVYAAEFVYKLFGPEEDEKDLPDHIFVKEKTPVTKVNLSQQEIAKQGRMLEEPTVKESYDLDITPVTRIKNGFSANARFLWLMVFFVFIFIGGSFYVYHFNTTELGTIAILGLKDQMIVSLNDKEIEMNDQREIQLESNKGYQLRVKYPGYHDFVKDFLLKSYEQKNIILRFKPLVPKTGQLTITTTPEGATVYINNVEWRQKTPVSVKKLELGKQYKVGLFLEGHKFISEDVNFEKTKSIQIQHSFVKDTARLFVSSDPVGASVVINDVLVGQTPYEDNTVIPDQVLLIAVKNDGYREQQQSLTLKGGEDKTINFSLQKE